MPNVPKWVQKLAEWAGLIAVFGVVGSLWINSEVERRMNELASNPEDAPAVVALVTDMQNVKDSQVRIEGKVDKFSQSFLAYLERQAQ